MSETKCKICGIKQPIWLGFGEVTPLQNYYTSTEIEALSFNTTSVSYILCDICHHVSINKKSKLVFDSNYNNEIQNKGGDMNQLAMVRGIIESRLPLKSERIIEVGCGRGVLLGLLKKAGYTNVLGYDPVATNAPNELVCPEYWNGECDVRPDLLILRHTLEEISDPAAFLKVVSDQKIPSIYVEITNISHSLTNGDPFSFYPECENLFSIGSLTKLMSNCQYGLDDVTMFFGGSWSGCWFRFTGNKFNPAVTISFCRQKILEMEKPVVLWGAGGRGSNIVSFCELCKEDIEFVVDINPSKVGKYIPPYGQRIISPEELSVVKAKTLIVSSKKFRDEIRARVGAEIKLVTMDELISSSSS